MATTNGKAPTLVVVQLAGGNDFMNTVIPYTNGLYYDYRPTVRIAEETVLPINDELAFNPHVAPWHGHLAHMRAERGGNRGVGWQIYP